MTFDTKETLDAVYAERLRQEELRKAGKFLWTCADPDQADADKLAVLMEEVGEVSREVVESIIARDKYARNLMELAEWEFEQTKRTEKLRAELTQVAAVCVAWLESLRNA